MKKIFLFVLVLIAQLTTNASYRNSMLRIREYRGRTISVTIDGKRFNKMARNLTIGDLPAGFHTISVFVYNSNGHGYRNGILAYKGNIKTKPGNIYYCSVDRMSMEVEENCCIDDYGYWNNNDNWDNWDEDNQCWNNNRNWKNDPTRKKQNEYYNSWNRINDNENWKHNEQERYNDDYNDRNWNNYSGVMTTGGYNQLIDQIRKASFESSKVSVANTALRNNRISVAQLVGILNEFSFESTRLDFAKSSYRYVADKRNYFQVNDVFTFQSSKDDLNEFLQKQN